MFLPGKSFTLAQSVRKVQDAIALYDVIEWRDEDMPQILNLHLYLASWLWRDGQRDAAFDALETARGYANAMDQAMHLHDDARIACQIPDTFPWWMAPDPTPVRREMAEDPRWAAWVESCRTE